VLTAAFTLFVRLGFSVLLSLPWAGILQTVAMSSLLAVFLSFLGVLYPALVAARMQPAVALRREE
jgi:ABC-type antimicrobial peptide transport system permease subunit